MKTDVKLPIGIEDFEKIRTEGFSYVDKTELIKYTNDVLGTKQENYSQPGACRRI